MLGYLDNHRAGLEYGGGTLYLQNISLENNTKDSIDATLIAIQKSSEIDDHYKYPVDIFLSSVGVFGYKPIVESKDIIRNVFAEYSSFNHLFINNNYIFY